MDDYTKSIIHVKDEVTTEAPTKRTKGKLIAEEELVIYRNLLIELHTARWCMDVKRVTKILDVISAYSYARTNSNGDVAQDERNQDRTLRELGDI